jgi:hypothetical protein
MLKVYTAVSKMYTHMAHVELDEGVVSNIGLTNSGLKV